jgi:DNA-binding beta-propeller fold protein YncE
VSPDNKSVYAGSNLSNAVARFNRNTTSGALTQPPGTAGCVSEDGSGPCADGHGLYNTHNLAVSGDGKSVYVASYSSSALVRFNRAP